MAGCEKAQNDRTTVVTRLRNDFSNRGLNKQQRGPQDLANVNSHVFGRFRIREMERGINVFSK